MDTGRSFSVNVSGVTVAGCVAGAGPPVVALHGALTSSEDMMIGLRGALAPEFTLIAIDRPGNGGSGRGLGTASPWVQAALVNGALQRMGVPRATLVGHSFGGLVAMIHALLFPDATAGVVALAPLAVPEVRAEHFIFGPRVPAGAGDALSFAALPADQALLPLFWRMMFQPQPIPPAFARVYPVSCAGERARLRAAGEEAMVLGPAAAAAAALYPSCRVPLRVLTGDVDRIVNPVLHGGTLAALAPDARLTRLPGVGHMLHHAAPDAVLAQVRGVRAMRQA